MKLSTIQQALKAPKGQVNKFGNYRYRSCEDILEAVKPLLDGGSLIISDSIEVHADRVYVKATVTLRHNGQVIAEASALAREPENKKGMDESQITGAASSYARKYALNGLFAIDDTKDADFSNTHGKAPAPKAPEPKLSPAQKDEILNLCGELDLDGQQAAKAIKWAAGGKDTKLDNLTGHEAVKLITFLKSKKS